MAKLANKLHNFYLSWYPEELRGKPRSRNIFNRVILVGILIRVIFMPFTAHNDFLSEHIRVFQIAEGIDFYPSFFQFVSHYMDAIFMKILLPFIPNASEVFVPLSGGSTTIEIANYMNFVDTNYIFRTLFMLKIPYLVVEMITVFLIIHLIKERKNILQVTKFLMINPVTIYAVYIFGRYEIYVFFLLMMSFYFAIRKRNYYLCGLFFGLSIVGRAYTAFLLPVLFMLLPKKIKNRIIFLVFSLLPISFVYFFEKFYNRGGQGEMLLVEGQFARFLFDYSLIALGGFKIQLFTLSYALLLIVVFYLTYRIKVRNTGTSYLIFESSQFYTVSIFCLLFFLIFYLTTPSAAQWFNWFIPFAAIVIAKKPKYFTLFYIFIGSWFCFWIFNSDIGVFTPYLFGPLDGEYFHQLAENFKLSLLDIRLGDIGVEAFINLFRTLYSAIIIWIMVLLAGDIGRELKGL